MDKKIITAELTLERKVKGESHKSTYEVRTEFSEKTCMSDVADFVEGMEKLWRTAMSAAKKPETIYSYSFEICEAVYKGDWEQVSFDHWVSSDIYGDINTEKGEEGIYFRADERYTSAYRDMNIGKNILRDMAYTMH